MARGAATVSARDLYRRVRDGRPVAVLDVRDRDEFEAWHVDGPTVTAAQVPYARALQAVVTGRLDDLVAETGLDEPLVVVCARGEASAEVAARLREEGFDAANLGGGMRAWARVYDAREVPGVGGDATVVQYERPSSGCLAYLVVSGDEAAVVDPLRTFAGRYARDADERGAALAYAVDTHVHADHVSGVRAVAGRSGAEVALPEGARDRGLAFDATLVGDGDGLDVGEATLTAVHTPGHTSEHAAFRAGDVAFTGDGLFLDGVGRPDLEGDGTAARELAAASHRTLHERFLAMPAGTLVAPGHVRPGAAPEPDGTYVRRLDRVRERLRLASLSREEYVERLVASIPPRPANYERIVAVNLGLESADAEAAFEMELGPNNCAVGD